METLIIHAENNKLEGLLNYLKTCNISFEKKEESYNAEFVAKIRESEADYKAGRYKKIETADLWK
jgi:hypothetical protein